MAPVAIGLMEKRDEGLLPIFSQHRGQFLRMMWGVPDDSDRAHAKPGLHFGAQYHCPLMDRAGSTGTDAEYVTNRLECRATRAHFKRGLMPLP